MSQAWPVQDSDIDLRSYVTDRLEGLRVNRYSWWTHWRELADYFLPRRYRWLITPNMMSRGSPLNQHIFDSTGVIAARNLAAGLLSGKCSPTRFWFKLKIGRLDSTQTSPVSLWLAECERLMRLVYHESNFYNSIATFLYDLVIFGTASMLIYEDFENVINCVNPCAGEYYVDIDGQYRPVVFYREFTFTISALVDRFGLENCSDDVQAAYKSTDSSQKSREIIVAHCIEPWEKRFGLPEKFKYVEAYWEYGGSSASQNGTQAKGFLEKRGYFERPSIIGRWDLVSNDPYGRSPAMDALPDQKQLQLETRRKAQAIDKMVNPPLVADIQLKNQPASLLPGGITYVAGYAASGKPGFASVYDTKFPVNEIKEDLDEVKDRLNKTFFVDLFRTASQFETRSNITAVEWDMRKSESLIMLGPAFERIDNEVLSVVIERTFNIMNRAGILPPAPPEVQGLGMDIEFVSTLQLAQSAAEATGIERLLGMAGNLVGVDPSVLDNIDLDFALDKYSTLMNNDPRIIRSPEQLAEIRANRQKQMEQERQVGMAEQLAKGAKTLSETQTGAGRNALEQMVTG